MTATSWSVTGQKLWTSLGDVARYGLLLARTDPNVPKHTGITVFLMPMVHPGVTVRPLRQLTGEAEFCEVFFDDARIDDSMRLGPVDEGWRVAISVLMNERQSISSSDAALAGHGHGSLRRGAHRPPRAAGGSRRSANGSRRRTSKTGS